ncbi:hypothetical protein [Halorubrum sp. 2020YC2]|uniref:hypothetical protein n=1 Tax=Halorubrum sp. 2020YC2 TaxID=2836432 RepID=UPI001BEBF82C|nr:hypothetical protein [Halorubrum sp. 2020YC2]QWC20222.1 hypothetical protein KI388_04525 [Halorubrum sp. 2020YC2]
MRAPVRRRDGRLVEAALAVGYLALAAAVAAAYTAPATGYELSIYAATPPATWGALAVAVGVSVAVCLSDERYLAPAVLLAGLGAATVAGLPLIRGYHFYGRADSLVHLGFARTMRGGGDPLELLYPGGHLIANSLTAVAGVETPRSMMLVMWTYALSFFASVACCVWFVVPDRRALAIGAFSGFLLLPINNVSTYLHFHTYSIGMLFVPFVIYLVFAHLVGGDGRERVVERLADGSGAVGRKAAIGDEVGFVAGATRPVPTTYLLPLVSVALVVVHPQIALNLVFLLGGMTVTQHAYRRFRPASALADYRLLTFQTVLLTGVFAVWIATHDWAFVSTAEAMIQSVTEFVAGEGETTPRVEAQGESASSIGASVQELFVKLFGVGAVYSLLAAGAVVGLVTGYLSPLEGHRSMRSTSDTAAGVTTLFLGGMVAILPFFAAHFVGSISTYLFRHVGFLTMLATIFGAVGVRYLLSTESPLTPPESASSGAGVRSGGGRSVGDRVAAALPEARSVVAVAVVVLVLSLSLATVFPSPFVYLSGSHMPDGEMDGYERTFASQADGSPVWFGGVRHSSDRYEVALYGVETAPWDGGVTPKPRSSGPVPEEAMLGGLPAFYANSSDESVRRDHYFAVAAADYQREVVAYRGLRYSQESFDAVASQPDVGAIRDNGELTVYYVDTPTNASAAADDG